MCKKILLFIIIYSSFLQANNKISIQGTFLENNNNLFIVLEKFEIGSRIIASTTTENSFFKLELQKNIEPGIYRLKYNQKDPNAFFDLIINGNENLIEIKYNCKDENPYPSFAINSENHVYYNFSALENKMLQALSIKLFFIQNYPNISDKAYQQIVKSYKKDIIKIKKNRSDFLNNNKNLFWATSLIRNKPIYIITDLKKDEKTIELEKQEKYWDTIDVSNSKLLNTPIFSDHILIYLQYYLNSNQNLKNEEIEIGLKQNVDKIVAHFSSNEATQKFAVLYLLKGFQEIGLQQMVTYIDKKYQPLIQKYSDQNQLETYQLRIDTYEKLKPGTLAPNIEWKEANKTEKSGLYQIKAKEIVLVFWSSECPHCEETMTKLDKWAINNKDKVVLAIGIENESEKANYYETIKKFKNILFYSDFKGFETVLVKEYFINATPTFYLINENKLIIKKYDYYPFE